MTDWTPQVLALPPRVQRVMVRWSLWFFAWHSRRVTAAIARLMRELADTDQARSQVAYEPWLSRLWEARRAALTTRIAQLTELRAAAHRVQRQGNVVLLQHGLGREAR